MLDPKFYEKFKEAERLRSQLEKVEAEMRRMLGSPVAPTPSPTTSSEKKAGPSGVRNLRGTIRDLLRRNQGTGYDAARVAKELGLPKDQNRRVRKALQNMAADREVTRVSEGVYRAKKK